MRRGKKLKLNFGKLAGLVPVVVQAAGSGEVLMVAFQNPEAFDLTCATGLAHFWSRTRQEIWQKGATSGNFLRVTEVWVDCDQDTILLKVKVQEALKACHTGKRSCFFTKIPFKPKVNCATPAQEKVLAQRLFRVFEFLKAAQNLPQSQTARLLKTKSAAFCARRAKEEWAELTGCRAGTHRHSANFAEDFLLESSQVFYWLALEAICSAKSFAWFWQMAELRRLRAWHLDASISFAKMLQAELRVCKQKYGSLVLGKAPVQGGPSKAKLRGNG